MAAEEILSDGFPDLSELEKKMGRKLPESLLMWMRRSAADWEDSRRSGGEHHNPTFCDKVNSLKQEMEQLRSADVRILRQLLAVHEGIEAMRWLMEEKGTLMSRDSSSTGSLSSLVMAEEPGSTGSAGSSRRSPAFPLDLPEVPDEEQSPQNLDPDPGFFGLNSSDVRPSTSETTVGGSAPGPVSPHTSVGGFGSQKQDFDAARLQSIRSGAETIRRALLRSTRAGRHLDVDFGGSCPGQSSLAPPAAESFTRTEENDTAEAVLLGYDAQWCWVESQDDVTFL